MPTRLTRCIGLAALLVIITVTSSIGQTGQTKAVYDVNWHLRYYMKDNALYNLDWQLQYYIRDDSVFDKGWIKRYYLKDDGLYDWDWHRRYYIKELKPPGAPEKESRLFLAPPGRTALAPSPVDPCGSSQTCEKEVGPR